MNDSPRKSTPALFSTFRHWAQQSAALAQGTPSRSANATRMSATLANNDLICDLACFAMPAVTSRNDLSERQIDLLQSISGIDMPKLSALQELWRELDGISDLQDWLDIHLAILGDADAFTRELRKALAADFTGYNRGDLAHGWVWILGLASELRHAEVQGTLVDVSSIRGSGIAMLGNLGTLWPDFSAAMSHHLGDDDPIDMSDPKDALFAALRGASLEALATDTAEIDRNFRPAFTQPKLETLQVMGPLDTSKMSQSRKDQTKSLMAIAGKQLPIPAAPADLGDWSAEMRLEFPHLGDAIDRIAMMLAPMRSIKGLRLLFVGPPGAGKTEFGQALFRSWHMESLLYSCGGNSDGMISGTSSGWSSGRPSVILNGCATFQCGGPGVLLDEADKIGTSKHNGNLADALLGFLEPSSSKRIMDPLIEQPVDLSAVNYIATANVMEDVPGPLRDRFKIINVPGPTWQHIGPLTSSIITRIADERGLDRRWVQPLAEDELELLKSAWTGGSLRRLRQATEVLLTGRDAQQRRH